MSKTNFEVHMKHVKALLSGEMKLVMSSVCTISLNFEVYSLEFQWEIVFGIISDNYLSF